MRSRGMRPDSTAATTASTVTPMAAGASSTSDPASSASTAASPAPYPSVIAAMRSASVKRMPPNPISPRRSSVMNSGDMVAGRLSPSTPGTATCAVITASTPASTAMRKGRSSTRSRRSRSAAITGSSMCESVRVSPCPGKCLAVVRAPPARAPRMKAAPSRPTASGSSPKERVLITGLSGLLFTSSTGAKSQCTPTARASAAVTRPYSKASSSSPAAPKAIVGGKLVPPPCARSDGSA